MNTITESAAACVEDDTVGNPNLKVTQRRRLRLILAGAGVMALAVLVAGPATAQRFDRFIHRAPQSAQEADRMEIIYQGQSYSWAQIYAMQASGEAMFTLEEPATYSKGQAYAFDSEAEAQSWACTNIANLAKRPACQAYRPLAP